MLVTTFLARDRFRSEPNIQSQAFAYKDRRVQEKLVRTRALAATVKTKSAAMDAADWQDTVESRLIRSWGTPSNVRLREGGELHFHHSGLARSREPHNTKVECWDLTLAVVARINLWTKQSSFSVLLLFLSNRYHRCAYYRHRIRVILRALPRKLFSTDSRTRRHHVSACRSR